MRQYVDLDLKYIIPMQYYLTHYFSPYAQPDTIITEAAYNSVNNPGQFVE